MNDILQTNIFFFITAIAAVCIAIFVIWVLYRLARLLKVLERMSQIMEEELYTLREDFADVRHFVRSEGVKLRHMLGFVSVLFTLGQKIKGRSERYETSQTGRGRATPVGRASPRPFPMGGREKHTNNTDKTQDDE